LIKVSITDDDGIELGQLRIQELEERDGGWWQYTVGFAVDRGSAVGLHSKAFMFRHDRGNVLALVQTALATLDEEELVMEDGWTGASDVAWRQRGIRQALSGEATDTVRDYRSSLWRGQSE